MLELYNGTCMPYINPPAIRIKRSVTSCMRSKVTAMCSRERITHNRSLEECAVTTPLIWSICKSDYYGSSLSLLTGRCISVKSTLLSQALQNSRLWKMNSQTLYIQIWIVQHSGKNAAEQIYKITSNLHFSLRYICVISCIPRTRIPL